MLAESLVQGARYYGSSSTLTEGDFEQWISASVQSVKRYHLALSVKSCQSKNIVCVGNKFINLPMNLDSMCSNEGFKLLGGNTFLESIRVDSETVGVGRSVCLYLLVRGEKRILWLSECFGKGG